MRCMLDRATASSRAARPSPTRRACCRAMSMPIMIRTTSAAKLEELARHATVPVINGLTDATHPCQVMADVMTLRGAKGPITGKIVAWSGDGNNVATSWMHAAVRFGFELRLACPDGAVARPPVPSPGRRAKAAASR